MPIFPRNNALILAPGAVTLQEVVDVLNVLGTTPRDMITILQAMSGVDPMDSSSVDEPVPDFFLKRTDRWIVFP